MGYSVAQLYYLCTQEVPKYLHNHLCKAPVDDTGESGVKSPEVSPPPTNHCSPQDSLSGPTWGTWSTSRRTPRNGCTQVSQVGKTQH